MRKYLVFVVGVLAIIVAGIYTWQRYLDYQLALATWDNYIIGNGFWLHPHHKAVKQVLFVQQYEAEIAQPFADAQGNSRGVELKDLRDKEFLVSLTLPSLVARDGAYSLPSSAELTPVEVVQYLNRKGSTLRLLIAQELSPQNSRFIEQVNFLSVKPDATVESVE